MNYDMRKRVEDYIMNSTWYDKVEKRPYIQGMDDEELFSLLLYIVGEWSFR